MNRKKSVLGRGLGTILRNPDTDITTKSEENNVVGNISTIKISEISTNPFQPRKEFQTRKTRRISTFYRDFRNHSTDYSFAN